MTGGPPVSTATVLAALFITWMIFPLVLLAATFTFLLYPSGLLSTRWRPVLWLGFVLLGLYALAPFLSPTVEVTGAGAEAQGIEVPNPVLLADAIVAPDGAFFVSLALMTFCGLAAVCSALVRAWRSTGVERLQMRLFAFSVVLLLGVLWPAQYLATHGQSLGRYILLASAFALIPVSCGIAILRYHLYDIDRVIGRTTAYVLVTGVLLGVYVLIVTSVGRLLPESSDLAVAVGTLTAAALFRPVLGWAQSVVARRFNREQYDADHVVEQFAQGLRGAVDSAVVQADLMAVLERTLQPSGSALWLRDSAP
jgi:hypothetical protein